MRYINLLINTFIITVLLSIPAKIVLSNIKVNSNPKINHPKSESIPDFAYAEAIQHQLNGSRIITKFAPQNSYGENIDLEDLASSLGYIHFNWVSYVEKDPYGIKNHAGQQLSIPYNDPPQGGYQYDPADHFPFYWDMVRCDRCNQRYFFENPNNLQQFELIFQDVPADYRLQPGEAVEFITNLVGVRSYDLQQQQAKWEILHTFRWKLTNHHPYFSQVSLVEADVDLAYVSPALLRVMKLDGAVISPSLQVSQSEQ